MSAQLIKKCDEDVHQDDVEHRPLPSHDDDMDNSASFMEDDDVNNDASLQGDVDKDNDAPLQKDDDDVDNHASLQEDDVNKDNHVPLQEDHDDVDSHASLQASLQEDDVNKDNHVPLQEDHDDVDNHASLQEDIDKNNDAPLQEDDDDVDNHASLQEGDVGKDNDVPLQEDDDDVDNLASLQEDNDVDVENHASLQEDNDVDMENHASLREDDVDVDNDASLGEDDDVDNHASFQDVDNHACLQEDDNLDVENRAFLQEDVDVDVDNDQSDPAVTHFQHEMSSTFVSNFNKIAHKEAKLQWPALGELIVNEPSSEDPSTPLTKKTKLAEFCLKNNVKIGCEASKLFKHPDKLSPLQSEMFSIISNYKDFHFTGQSHLNHDDTRLVYCLHALNHILKARAKIIHHNSKQTKNPDEEYRDQGYTRPTVLILVPFKESCLKIVNVLSSLLQNCEILKKKRFQKEYGSEKRPPRKKPRPADYEATFAGNVEEDFKIGLRIKNRSMSLYVNFYAADMIIASPLGLRTIVGAEGDQSRDFDFLSSIEILILDEADVLMMQNWMHVTHLARHLNLQPKEPHGCNFFRVRLYALEGWSKFYRQTLLFSAIEHPYHRALFSVHCFNYSGYVRTWQDVKVPSICQVLTPMPQVFQRFEPKDHVSDPDERFEFFVSKILPSFKDSQMAQTFIFVPSYYDFVRLRNHFRSEEISCTMICEYSEPGKIAQGRNLFYQGHRHFMLYTERFHFYHRYSIKGIQHILFYQLPSYPSFYQEICNFLLNSNSKRKNLLADHSCTVIFSKFDCQQLKHVVGLKKAQHMVNSSKNVFMLQSR